MVARRSSRHSAPRVHDCVARRAWTIASDVQAISPIVETVQSLCVAAGFSPSHCRLNIPVAVTEALSNAIIRGNAGVLVKRVQVVVVIDATRLIVEVTDEGEGFDLDAMQHTPDDAKWLEREDGRGVFLMRSLMNAVESLRLESPRGHMLRLVLHRS